MQLYTAKIEIKPYNGFVYDIEVDRNHTLLVKYGSCVHWNSNCKCDFRAIIPEMGDEVQKEVEKNRYYKQVARGY